MHISTKILGAAAAVAFLSAGAVSSAQAQSDWPNKTITWIVPFGAGGGTDRWSRIMSSSAPDHFDGHGWHVRNRPGGSGIAGWKALLDSPADGHTILMNSSTPVIALALETKPAIDPAKDIKICAFVSSFRSYVMALKDSKYQSVDDVVKASKAGEQITLAGTQSHLLGQANFWSQLGANLTYVSYDGTGQAMADFLGGHVDLGAGTGTVAAGFAPAQAVVLANTSDLGNPEGMTELVGSETPAASEFGVDGLSFPRWVGVHPDTPDAICKQISDSVGSLLKDKSVLSLVERINEEVIFSPMDEAQKKYTAGVKKFTNAASLLQ
ncbi:MAG: tripartite tricarboxylate transporter substrate binding protein [Acetobacterales bacterium]